MVPVWSAERVTLRVNEIAAPYRVGALIEWLDDLQLVEAPAVKHTAAYAKALALSAFDRFEWGQLMESHGNPYFVDLERLLPPYSPEDLYTMSSADRDGYYAEWQGGYEKSGIAAVCEVLDHAEKAGIATLVRSELASINSRGIVAQRCFAIPSHPLDAELRAQAIRALHVRIESIRAVLSRSDV